VRIEEEEVEQQNLKRSQARVKWDKKKSGAVSVTDFDRSVTTL